MCAVAPLTISGWHTVLATVLVVVLTVGYGELRAHDIRHRPPARHQRRRPHHQPAHQYEEDNRGARDR